MSTSNQNAGADRKPCKWCQLWQAAYWASRLEYQRFPETWRYNLWRFEQFGDAILERLSERETDCLGCQKARLIQQGIHQTPAETAWRAEQWRDNPTVRWMMRKGEHDTFTEAGDEG